MPIFSAAVIFAGEHWRHDGRILRPTRRQVGARLLISPTFLAADIRRCLSRGARLERDASRPALQPRRHQLPYFGALPEARH